MTTARYMTRFWIQMFITNFTLLIGNNGAPVSLQCFEKDFTHQRIEPVSASPPAPHAGSAHSCPGRFPLELFPRWSGLCRPSAGWSEKADGAAPHSVPRLCWPEQGAEACRRGERKIKTKQTKTVLIGGNVAEKRCKKAWGVNTNQHLLLFDSCYEENHINWPNICKHVVSINVKWN